VTAREDPPAGASGDTAGERPVPPKVFINYRHSDSGGWAMALHQLLAARFGAENVFLDVATLQPGRKWLDDIRSHGEACGAFIALIGRSWESIVGERGLPGSEEDYVRSEIELALRRGAGVDVIPTLVDEADVPREDRVPPTLRPLLRRHVHHLRPARWAADVEELVARLESIEPAAEPQAPPVVAPPRTPPPPPRDTAADDEGSPARPGRRHYDDVVKLMLDEAAPVVPFIGPGANSSDREEPWSDLESSYLPDAEELAAYLAQTLDVGGDGSGLARVSQHVLETEGEGRLYRVLRQTLTQRCPPGSVHRFLAAVPGAFRKRGLERYQLIVTTNYDDALERAFQEAEEAYDLAVYMASGADKGKFVHFPHGGGPEAVAPANAYRKFPIDTWGGLTTRTVIVKIHGAVDGAYGEYAWRNNYVITEDDYIDYLSHSPVESVVPTQILEKLMDSNFLFLGYSMRDWNLRVFLQRIFGQHVPNKSWAVQRTPDALDREFWKNMQRVELFALPLGEYVSDLAAHLASFAPAR
jgi:SIR2-like protein/TIR domain-containing protein